MRENNSHGKGTGAPGCGWEYLPCYPALWKAAYFGEAANADFNLLEGHIHWDSCDDDCSLFLHAVDPWAYTLPQAKTNIHSHPDPCVGSDRVLGPFAVAGLG